jgi:hypothetical protein
MANQYEMQARTSFRSFDFATALQTLQPLADKYNLQSNQALGNLLYDASLLSNINGDAQESATTQGEINIVQGLKDPEDVLIGYLDLDQQTREQLVASVDSLDPIYKTKQITVTNTTTDNGQMLQEVKSVFSDTKAVYKISFILDNYQLDAYVMQHGDDSLQLYEIKDPTGKAPYYSVAQWQKMDANVRAGKPALDGVFELSPSASSSSTPSASNTSATPTPSSSSSATSTPSSSATNGQATQTPQTNTSTTTH